MSHLSNRDSPRLPGRGIKLAPGIELNAAVEDCDANMLILEGGRVHLNQHALTILMLCDGSRSRDRVVVEALMRGGMKTSDVVAFLDAAQSRGWIVDSG